MGVYMQLFMYLCRAYICLHVFMCVCNVCMYLCKYVCPYIVCIYIDLCMYNSVLLYGYIIKFNQERHERFKYLDETSCFMELQSTLFIIR